MIFVYNLFTNLLRLLLNIVFIIQIALLILVFITAAYWFCDLVGSPAFSFATPLVENITNVMSSIYSKDIETSGGYIDGTLLLFDTLSLVIVFLLAKSKYYIHKVIENIGYLIIDCKRRNEEKFNKGLKEESDALIRRYKKVAMIIELEANNMTVNSVWGGDDKQGVKEKQEEAYNILSSALKTLEGCRIAETDGKLVILLDDFDKVDNLIYFVQQATSRINENMKKNRWQVFFYMAADVYYATTDFKKEVYPALEELLKLKYKNEILCFGNFNIRYSIKPDQVYHTISLKGTYDINGGSDVYSIVKKD